MYRIRRYIILVLLLVISLILMSCAPGNDRWNQQINPEVKAGFWVGVWHGFIIVITFIVSLFTDEVGLYELNNTGWPYNLGFIIGLFLSVGGGLRIGKGKLKMRKRHWEQIGEKIEERVRKVLHEWLGETRKEEREKEWEEIAKKIEEKIKKVIKDWIEKE